MGLECTHDIMGIELAACAWVGQDLRVQAWLAKPLSLALFLNLFTAWEDAILRQGA